FTTFSTFGYEVIALLEGGSFMTAGLYTLLSIVVGFTGVALGVGLARLI
ncbi:MAG TPA: fluoride efflux transporter CrcB, partial [Desulfosporosinus sp.]|nr:fluoride efflux transporter CrcB [Desulfosporosinus sp.]